MDGSHNQFVPDECQREVICAKGGFHLVLAPPGCGKTQILTERIRHAHEADGVAYADMLCLTFTNRAARGMVERIAQHIGDSGVADVFVGNVHRFCSKFLFANALVAAESCVIDDDDSVSIIARYTGDDEYAVADNYARMRQYNDVMHLESMMHQIEHGYPRELRTHTDCLSAGDIAAMRQLCKVTGRDFTPQTMMDIFEHSDTYGDVAASDTADFGDRQIIVAMLKKMSLAWRYRQYKKQNSLLDFHDLLMFTYDALASDDSQTLYRRYPWVQVDEVQDLNPLQMAIIRMLVARPFDTVMFLGDEQQAIFSFMGAKLDALAAIKTRSACQLHHLNVNHRSPAYLLDIFNTYAAEVLHIDTSLLPQVGRATPGGLVGNELGILYSDSFEQEVRDCVQFAHTLSRNFPTSNTALVVNANRDAELLSAELGRCGIPHFKVSGSDLFASPEVKLLFAHMGVLNNEFAFMSWARIVNGVGVYANGAAARNFVRKLLDNAIMPSDLLRFDNGGTYLQRFVDCYDTDTIVVFDTETTGLDVFNDDILQIAAVKIRHGEVMPGSELTLYIETDKPIPAMLGDIVNPIVEERKHHRLYQHAEALTMFMEYAEGCVLLGHNADYDYHILDFNLRRYVPGVSLAAGHPSYLDSLRLVRLLHPELREHKLKFLLSALGLEGTNSHLADDDVNATRSVVVHCYGLAKDMLPRQRELLGNASVRQRVDKLRSNYRDVYLRALDRMYCVPDNGGKACVENDGETRQPALVGEMMAFYNSMRDSGLIAEIEGIGHIAAYLSGDMIDAGAEPSLYEQLANHAVEISTLKEADLCGSGSMDERIFVTTIHKAKGLEFENVIVFDAVDGRMPNFYSRDNARLLAEDARKFYVALTRARLRLYVSQCISRTDYHNVPHEVYLTPFMMPVAKFFKTERFSDLADAD